MFAIIPQYLQASAASQGINLTGYLDDGVLNSLLNAQDVKFYTDLQVKFLTELFPEKTLSTLNVILTGLDAPLQDLPWRDAVASRTLAINAGVPVGLFDGDYIGTSTFMEVIKTVRHNETPFYVISLKDSFAEGLVPFDREHVQAFLERVLLENLDMVKFFPEQYSCITKFNA